jgi:hypothetical protein
MPRSKEPVEPVRIYAEDDIRLPKRLAAVLVERIEGYSDTILSGSCDLYQYKSITGQIAGLREALRICEEIVTELQE